MHNKFYVCFFLLLMVQCSSWYMFFDLNTPVVKKSELISISSFKEICISLNAKYVNLSWELGLQLCNSLFFSYVTDQAF